MAFHNTAICLPFLRKFAVTGNYFQSFWHRTYFIRPLKFKYVNLQSLAKIPSKILRFDIPINWFSIDLYRDIFTQCEYNGL